MIAFCRLWEMAFVANLSEKKEEGISAANEVTKVQARIRPPQGFRSRIG